MSNIIDGVNSGLLINQNTASAAGASNSEAFSQLLASEMLELSGDGASSSKINELLSAAQLSGASDASMANLKQEILSQVQSVSASQNASAAAYQPSTDGTNNFWKAPVRTEGTTEYFDYDVTASFEPTSTPSSGSYSWEGG